MTLNGKPSLSLRRLGIDTYREAVIYMRNDCHVCTAEGFEVQARVKVHLGDRSLIATLNIIHSDALTTGEASLSEYAWNLLSANEGDLVQVSHPAPLSSFSYVRSKIYGNTLSSEEIKAVLRDIVAGRYSDIHISAFLTACAGGRLSLEEVTELTQAMVQAGGNLRWPSSTVVDKHCIGGLPGNRTTPIVVSIISAFGLTMPKTSSRAITSPAGTADTMEVLTSVELDMAKMQQVVEKEGACIVWGGTVSLSPADDLLIRIEKALDLDSEGQLVASVLSKKIAAGSTHVVIDIPVGPTAKVRNQQTAERLKDLFEKVGKKLGIAVKVLLTDGTQPIGYGIGPALEATDILSVLQNLPDAPKDLRERALLIAGSILEFSQQIPENQGIPVAQKMLDSGKAWNKFKAICHAQGGMKEVPTSNYTEPYLSEYSGVVSSIDNRRLALIAKLAGAPENSTSGIKLHVKLGSLVQKEEPLFTIHAHSKGELDYAVDYVKSGNHIMTIKGDS